MKIAFHTIVNVKKIIKTLSFAAYREDTAALEKAAAKYRKFSNIILVGSGGSVNNMRALLAAVPARKKVTIVDTVDPALLEKAAKENPKNKTLVIAVSKSGETVTTIEALLYFAGYTTVAIAGGGALVAAAKKMKWQRIDHAGIGGRFSANTASLLFPMIAAGMDARAFAEGLYSSYENNALDAEKLASFIFSAERKGKTDLFVPVYSSKLSGTFTLITQLLHETACKDGKGITVFGGTAPETQHHTNQRLFGGRKNVSILFLLSEEKGNTIKVPAALNGIPLREGNLSGLKGNYADSLRYEYEGTLQHAKTERIPCATISLDKINERSIGELIGVLQMTAVFLARMDKVNPFNQPAVEKSKEISLRKRTGTTAPQKKMFGLF